MVEETEQKAKERYMRPSGAWRAGAGRQDSKRCAQSRKGFRKGKTQPGLGWKKLPLTASRRMESGSGARADAAVQGRDDSGQDGW